jgi:hypothetical protein
MNATSAHEDLSLQQRECLSNLERKSYVEFCRSIGVSPTAFAAANLEGLKKAAGLLYDAVPNNNKGTDSPEHRQFEAHHSRILNSRVAKIADGTIFQAQRGDSILGWTTSMRPLSSIQFSMA